MLVAYLGVASVPAAVRYYCTISGEELTHCCCVSDGLEALVEDGSCCCEVRKPRERGPVESTARVVPADGGLAHESASAQPRPCVVDTRLATPAPLPSTRGAPPLFLLLETFRT